MKTESEASYLPLFSAAVRRLYFQGRTPLAFSGTNQWFVPASFSAAVRRHFNYRNLRLSANSQEKACGFLRLLLPDADDGPRIPEASGRAVLDHAVGVSLFIADAAAEPGRSAALALLLAVGGDHSVKRPLPLPLQNSLVTPQSRKSQGKISSRLRSLVV